ncbi:TerD family protein [Geodermatophilus sp. CPCC 205506]|uniref:TerD family protein n=1 Tax=Geodermatophilus sp. CPCC 205506 TaxID=2936596 RepID=UPI003EE9150F
MVDYTKRPRQPAAPPPQQQPPPPPPGPPSAGYEQWGPPAAPQQQHGAPPPAPQQQHGAPPPAPGVSLGKVTLTKSAPSVSLTKTAGTTGVLRVNLNWNARPAAPQGGGFLKRLAGAASGGIDLDLGCLYEYADGSRGVIQALGNAFRGQHTLPNGELVAWLDGDDRSGRNTGGENLLIDLRHTAHIRRILVFAFIYQGTPNWADADAVVTLFPASGPQVEIRLDEHDPRARLCAIASFTNQGGQLVVNREVRYVHGGQDVLDQQYGWGMNWAPGRK